MAALRYPPFNPELQIAFAVRLGEMSARHLFPALSQAVKGLKVTEIDGDLARLVANERLAYVASAGLRGEVVYPVPCVLAAQPRLLGYYRLLFGLSQKEFFKTPFARWRAMEEGGQVPKGDSGELEELCSSLCETAWRLVSNLDSLSLATLHDLQVLTLDPVIAVSELLGSGVSHLLSIEVKGGTDVSNVHNRIGEAEKSHQKARAAGFKEFWTVVNAPLNPARAKQESPTTNGFFQLARLLDDTDPEWLRFRDQLCSRLGIAV